MLALRVTLLVQKEDRSRPKKDRKALALIHRIFRACWVENLDPAKADVMQALCNEVGVNGRDLVERASGEEAKKLLMKTTNDALSRGVFGVPSFIVNDHVEAVTAIENSPFEEDASSSTEPALFWGNDRLEVATLASRGNKPLLRGDRLASL